MESGWSHLEWCPSKGEETQRPREDTALEDTRSQRWVQAGCSIHGTGRAGRTLPHQALETQPCRHQSWLPARGDAACQHLGLFQTWCRCHRAAWQTSGHTHTHTQPRSACKARRSHAYNGPTEDPLSKFLSSLLVTPVPDALTGLGDASGERATQLQRGSATASNVQTTGAGTLSVDTTVSFEALVLGSWLHSVHKLSRTFARSPVCLHRQPPRFPGGRPSATLPGGSHPS